MDALKHQIHTAFKTTVEAVTPHRTSSAFADKGVLTPEEFVLAGDKLVRACPTWSWSQGDVALAKAYLPREKQFLVTKNVPCARRAKDMEAYAGGERALDDVEFEGWVAAGEGQGGDATREDTLPEIGELRLERDDDDDDDESNVPDMEEFEDEDDDAVVLPTAARIAKEAGSTNGGVDDDGIVKTRTYDVSITYDKYYQTPRVWLNGYDEARLVLKPEKAMEDVSADHAQKTVTIDPHPHTGVPSASIHPCKHGSVMKKLITMMMEDKGMPNVDTYLFVFLKFIASVVPTIEYDYTL